VDASADLLRLDETLNTLAALYQFRSTEDRLYGALTVSQSYCLRMVYVRGPRTMGQLAAELGVRLSTMTTGGASGSSSPGRGAGCTKGPTRPSCRISGRSSKGERQRSGRGS
jgi:hypothetical protein